MDEPRLSLDEIWNVIVAGDDVERRPLSRRLESLPAEDKRSLTERVLKELEGDSKPTPGEDPGRARRGWLLTTLVRIATPDNPLRDQARSRALEGLEPSKEPYGWARYWVLESFCQCTEPALRSKDPQLREMAQAAFSSAPTGGKDGSDLFKSLGYVILALDPAHEAVAAIKAFLKFRRDPDSVPRPEDLLPWFSTRPFRTVYCPHFAPEMIQIIHDSKYSDAVFDALGFLSRIPRGSERRGGAAAALAKLVKDERQHSYWDPARIQAIEALGLIGDEEHVPVVAKDLCDDNPAVVRAAAGTIATICGDSAVPTVLDLARRAVVARPVRRESILDQYGTALRWLTKHRATVITELSEILGSARDEDRQIANELLVNLGGAKAYEKLRNNERFVESLRRSDEQVQRRIEDVTAKAQEGLKTSRSMDVVVFAVGIVLVLCVCAAAIAYSEGKVGAIVGVVGVGGPASFLLSAWLVSTRTRILEATQWLVHVQAAFMGYTRQLHQADQAFAQRLSAGGKVEPSELESYSAIVDSAMKRMLVRLAKPPTQSWFARGVPASTPEDPNPPRAPVNGPAPATPAQPPKQP
ncbi:MAG: HEAT repeat domain-containing protein [Phycisphaerales bacterium]